MPRPSPVCPRLRAAAARDRHLRRLRKSQPRLRYQVQHRPTRNESVPDSGTSRFEPTSPGHKPGLFHQRQCCPVHQAGIEIRGRPGLPTIRPSCTGHYSLRSARHAPDTTPYEHSSRCPGSHGGTPSLPTHISGPAGQNRGQLEGQRATQPSCPSSGSQQPGCSPSQLAGAAAPAGDPGPCSHFHHRASDGTPGHRRPPSRRAGRAYQTDAYPKDARPSGRLWPWTQSTDPCRPFPSAGPHRGSVRRAVDSCLRQQ